MNGHLDIVTFGMHICKKLVCLALFVARSGLKLFLADLKEALQAGDSFIKLTQFFVNETDPLVALSLLLFVVCALAGLEALLKVLEGAIEFIPLLEIDSDDLVHTHELA